MDNNKSNYDRKIFFFQKKKNFFYSFKFFSFNFLFCFIQDETYQVQYLFKFVLMYNFSFFKKKSSHNGILKKNETINKKKLLIKNIKQASHNIQ